jgi:hypothetical protein
LRSKLKQGGTIAYIRAENLLADIAGAVSAARFSQSVIQYEDAKQSFASYVSSDAAPTFVLLDDVQEPAVVAELIPPSCHSLVVVTSREPVLPQGRGAVLAVKKMEDDEAKQLVRHLRPQTTETDAELLTAALGARPLAIVHSCGFIGDGYLYSVSDFCRDLDQDAAAALGQAVRPIEWTLSWIYDRFLYSLNHSDDGIERDAAMLLEFVAFLGNEAMPYDLVALPFCYQLAEQLGSGLEGSEQRKRLAGAIYRAQRAYLLEPRPDGLTMHPLTQALLNALVRRGEYAATLTLLSGSIVTQLRTKTELSPVAIPEELISWLPHILRVADAIFEYVQPESWERLDIFGALSIAVAGLRQIGHVGEVHRLRHKYFGRLQGLVPRLRQTGSDLKSPGFRAFVVDLMTSAYDLGEFDFEEYLAHIAPALAEADSGRGPVLYPHEILRIAQKSVDGGWSALEQLEELEETWPNIEDDLSPEYAADLHRIKGESHILGGDWSAARLELDRAWTLYEDSNQITRLQGISRTLKDLIDLDCFSGLGFSEQTLHRLAEDKASEHDTVITRAFVYHSQLRVMCQFALYKWLGRKLPPGIEQDLDPRYDKLIRLFLGAYTAYVNEGSPRLAITLLLDWLTAKWAVEECQVAPQLKEAAALATEHLLTLDCWPNPLVKLVTVGKLLLLEGSALDVERITELWDSSEAGSNRGSAVHLCYEGLMIGWLAWEINKMVNTDEKLGRPEPNLDSIRQGLESLGLSRRWEPFSAALKGIRERDRSALLLGVGVLHMY